MAGGRPTDYTEELGIAICEAVASSTDGVHKLFAGDEWPAVSSIFLWLAKYPEFSERYAQARANQAKLLAQQIIEIADDGANDTYIDSEGREVTNHDHIQRSKLRVDARKWVASKLLPKVYGDKLDVTSDGEKLEPTKIIIEHIKPDTDAGDKG